MEVLELMCVPKAADGVEGENVGFLLLGTVMDDVGFVEASGEVIIIARMAETGNHRGVTGKQSRSHWFCVC